MPLLIGPLAEPALRLRLSPDAVATAPLSGQLLGGALAGIAPDAFPVFLSGPGALPAWQTGWTHALQRYAEIFGLNPVMIEGHEVLGIGIGTDDSAWQPQLAGAIADWLLALPPDRSVAQIRHRLPMIAGWVASRQRAAAESDTLPLIGPVGEDRWQMVSRTEPYANYFSIESLTLRQRRHRGDWSPDMLRAVFVSGDATVVLPWDPVRDRVMLIDQFRAGPAARGDLQPWLYETVAGRVDAGEAPENAARREAIEETGLHISRLVPGPHSYPSPGAMSEYLYLYVGIADLPDEAAGFGGLDTEDEDIRSHLIPRAELTRMAMSGELRNGPLLMLAMWLELAAKRISSELASSGAV
ncbi:NUDIX domain-containing protein [Paracoccus laeviglucosivorans]|uniref:ADP-ribose pyrophosphatase n=1 Tax=Paracoccus laeviglucosivorans TaxID=1197861 RepID=A0A521CNY2_9RHOB|nr:NUDIX domain-containing protein [Paracoccus laeviglucosivorans]SMO60370.1 nudix-type nucleoside diphosphatase, YffH/AdpP family [Paracoccus laeviglucosivorans]